MLYVVSSGLRKLILLEHVLINADFFLPSDDQKYSKTLETMIRIMDN